MQIVYNDAQITIISIRRWFFENINECVWNYIAVLQRNYLLFDICHLFLIDNDNAYFTCFFINTRIFGNLIKYVKYISKLKKK